MKKIKGCLSKPEPAALIAIAALSLCALLPLRVVHVTTLIDPTTGFFDKTNFTVPLFYAIGAVVAVVLFALSYLNSKATRTRDCVAKSKSLGIVSVLTALSIAYSSVIGFSEFIQLNAAYSDAQAVSYTSYLTQSGAAALAVEGIMGLLSVTFFCLYAVSCFKKNFSLSSFALLSVTPTLWAISRIVFRFLEKISFVNVSDLLLELITLAFMIMFTLTFAQIVTGSTPEVCAWRLFGCGLPTAVAAFVTNMPRLFLVVTGKSELITEGYAVELCDIALAVFIPIFLYHTATAKKADKN